ncbi:hypothetical protein ABBQ38_013354 [Trebouxia sp. C0009 RCD-2024]
MAPSIPVHPVGSQGFKASAQGLGCMGMSAFYKDIDHQATEEESIAVIHRAIELGVTLLDTSDIYGPFTNEKLVGRALEGKRSQVQLCTKFACKFTKEGNMTVDGSRKYVREACEASLKRLNTDYIDLYYMHRMDPKTPIEETMAELKALVGEGKIKYVGLSEVGPDDLRKAHKVHPISAVQLEWSLWTRDVEKDLVPVCRELGVGVVCYSPIGRGMLAGKYSKPEDIDPNDFRSKNPRFLGEAFAKNIKLVENVKKLAAKKNVTAGQMALAWLQHQGKDVFPIPGTKRLKYLEENAAAVGIQLSKQELKELENAVPANEVHGDRYQQAYMGATYSHYNNAKPQQ